MTDQWIIYQAQNAPEAAERLREQKREAVCVMQFDRRSPSRWVKPKPHEDAPKRTAWGNHLFVLGRVDQPTRARAQVRLWELQFGGRPGFLRPREVALLFDPDALWGHPKGKFWLDQHEPEARARWRTYIEKTKGDSKVRHGYRPGQRIRMEVARQRYERDILNVKGNQLEVGLGLLGMGTVWLHYADVESVEVAA